ncbi:hypothetical protein [Streptomyces sp. SID12488]|uniref:hypothetical protein n=1 Tax=Streptomyces sp. SID12488 TaxID=2706040 RepID=UPI0013DD5E55|nr:hypothetical protein [Streptomyces sp. SID12488]NEA63823.1 hypothetical protein [Streptomyces sp. SID12488]
MRSSIGLTRDGEAFLARFTPAQAEACHRALSFLYDRTPGATARAVQLGTDPKAVASLTERLAGERKQSFELRLPLQELHILHSALTATAVMFLERGAFSQEEFYRRTTFYREHFDALASGIVEAASKV